MASDKVVTIAEDGAYVFSGTDFGFSDPDVGDTLQAVVIVSVTGSGTLKLGSATVVAGQTIDASQISQLIFTPSGNANGSPLGSIGFKVSDGSLESAVGTIRINVTAVNDAPVANSDMGAGLVTAEDTPLTVAASITACERHGR